MRKICPFHKYDFMQIIPWLNEQSSYGWQLEEWGTFFVKFSEGASEQYQYQMDMDDSKEEANCLRREELEKEGWKYVLTVPATRLHIYRSENRHALIPKSEYFCEYNRKKLQKENLLSIPLLGALLAVFLVLPVFKSEYFLLEFMLRDVRELLFYVLWTSFLAMQSLGEIWYARKLCKYLESDEKDSVLQPEREDRSYGVIFPAKSLEWIVLIFSIVAIYWNGASGQIGDRLFEQAFERYITYSRYYSGGFSKKNKEHYYIKDHWKITNYKKAGFEEMIVAEGTGDYNGDWMLFAKTENEIVILRYWGEASGEMLMEAIVEEYL